MEKRRRRYNREFKTEAVKLVTEGGNGLAAVARDLGIQENTLGRWKKELAVDPRHAFPGTGRMRPEAAELARLRRENKRLRMENEILKKTVGYFAKDES